MRLAPPYSVLLAGAVLTWLTAAPAFAAAPVIGTSTENDPINTASKYYTHYANGHYWVIFDHGGIPGCILYSSPDGSTWTSQGGIFAGNNPVSFTNEWSLRFQGNTVIVAAFNSPNRSYRSGTLNTNGTVTWSAESPAGPADATFASMNLLIANGRPIMWRDDATAGGGGAIWRGNAIAGPAWTKTAANAPAMSVAGVSNGIFSGGALFQTGGASPDDLIVLRATSGAAYSAGNHRLVAMKWNSATDTYDGAWYNVSTLAGGLPEDPTTEVQVNVDNTNQKTFAAVRDALGNIHALYVNRNGDMAHYKKAVGFNNSWSRISAGINPPAENIDMLSLTALPGGSLYLFYSKTDKVIYYRRFDGAAWGAESLLTDVSATNLKGALAPMESAVDCAVGLAFTEGNASPFNVRFTLGVGTCSSLQTTTATGTISVTAPGSFKLVFDEAFGGHPTQFYDLAESPIQDAVHDLAGGIGTQDGLFLDELTLLSDGFNYRSDKGGPAVNASVLEATETRALVRSDGYFFRASGFSRAGGIRTVGDWSLYGTGRMALHWERRTTSAVDTTFQQLHLNLHQQAAAPLSGWAGFSQGGPLCLTGCSGPAGSDFVLIQNEQAGARTDFLMILSQDWPAASESWGSGNVPQEWAEASWNRNAADTIPANSTDAWNFLTYFKPTGFVNHADAAVTTRAADYRGPDDLSTPAPPAAGAGWFDAAESTASPSDFFNEKEAAYTLDLDPALGLTFDMDGAASPRFQPFFKIRQWRALAPPVTITLEGVTLTQNVGFKADVMPISRASMQQDLLWSSTLQDAAAVTSPDVGSGGTLSGAVTFEAARFGSGARVSASGDSIRVPTAGNFDKAHGRIGFWYRPNYDNTDGVLHDLCGFATDANNYLFLEKRADNNLYFRIRAGGGGIAEVQVTSANYSWRANEWVHLRISWDDTLPLGTQQRLHVNDVEPPHVNPTVDYDSSLLVVPANLRFGNSDGDASFGPGVYDEIDIISDTTVLANAGLVGTASEYLADSSPAKNLPLDFAGVDPQRRGRYLFLSTTAKFRGLNIGLATNGAGVAAGALEWEYWNGTGWASLESVGGFTDQTNSLTRTGSVFWTADPPGWVPYSLSGGLEIYRIRVHLAAGSNYGTLPVEGVIRPDILLLQYCGDVTLDAQTFVINPPIPTEVRLQSFSATAGDGSVVLDWRTASELSNLGFHVYRALSDGGPWTRLTASLIPGLGSSAVGQAYSFRDAGLANGTRYFYRLDDVDAKSRTTSHGPVSALPLAGAAAGPPGGGPAPGRPGAAKKASCPEWVAAAYGAAAGAESRALVCTRHGDPEAVSLRVLSRDEREATLELQTGGFYALREPSGRVRVFVPGFDFPDDPQAPALPVRRALVDAVVGRRVQLGGVRALDLVAFAGLVPAALGQAEMQVSWDGTVRAGRRASRESSPGRVSTDLARLLPSVFQGLTKSAVVLVAPLRYDARRGQLVLAKRVRVRLLFTGRETGESGRGSLGRRERPRKPLDGEVLARLYTTSRGLYAATFEQLFPGSSRGVAATDLRLERQGQAVGFHLEPAGSLFGPGSVLYFHTDTAASSSDFSAETAFELVRARDGVQMPLASAAASGGAVRSASTVLSSFETNRFYQPGLLDAQDLWLWDSLVSGTTVTKSLSLAGVDASAPQPAELEVFLQGASESGNPVDHHVSVSVNGALAGEGQWAGKQPYRVSLSLPASLLRVGANELVLSNVGDTGVTSLAFLDRFTLRYPQAASFAGGRFEGTWSEAGTALVAGASGPVALLDVTAGGGAARRAMAHGPSGGRRHTAFPGRGRPSLPGGLARGAAVAARRGAFAVQPARHDEPGRLPADRAADAAGRGGAARGTPSRPGARRPRGRVRGDRGRVRARAARGRGDPGVPGLRLPVLGPPLAALRAAAGGWELRPTQLHRQRVARAAARAVDPDELPVDGVGPPARGGQRRRRAARPRDRAAARRQPGAGAGPRRQARGLGGLGPGARRARGARRRQRRPRGRLRGERGRHRTQLPRGTQRGAQAARARRRGAPPHPGGARRRLVVPELRGARRSGGVGERERLELVGRGVAPGAVAGAAAADAQLPERLLRGARLRLARGVAAEGRGARRHRRVLALRPEPRRARPRVPPRADGRAHERPPRAARRRARRRAAPLRRERPDARARRGVPPARGSRDEDPLRTLGEPSRPG